LERLKADNDGVFVEPQFIPGGARLASSSSSSSIQQVVVTPQMQQLHIQPQQQQQQQQLHPLQMTVAGKTAAIEQPLDPRADDILLRAKASAPADNDDPVARLEGDVTCVVCQEAPRQTLFAPCGHCCCCSVCSTLIVDGLCPICRQPFTDIVKIHIA
jgi:hypothetical protein